MLEYLIIGGIAYLFLKKPVSTGPARGALTQAPGTKTTSDLSNMWKGGGTGGLPFRSLPPITGGINLAGKSIAPAPMPVINPANPVRFYNPDLAINHVNSIRGDIIISSRVPRGVYAL